MIDLDKVDYVFKYFGQLMTEKEAKAWRHYSSEYKLTDGGEKEPNAIRKKMYVKKGWLSKDAEVLQLLDSGFETFKKSVVDRILKEAGNQVDFNNCPSCNKLARTPKAKQCRFCGHDWH